ncbi:ExbD/TolR family protein [Gayadomonas joobiniege]|uniref:ExbD/TolR family protein n=1 Tax=Gayadomonas joobiniege TaxID=1234606 RepID=UPI00037525C8|nr:biopolymer transporter ExbD [Gayadomonas joobiniege]
MASRLVQKLENQTMQTIDMSPLLDVVFILLIFFIVSTVFVKETGVEVDKPQAISAQKLDQMSILIALTADGRVVYDGKNIGIAGIRNTLSQVQSSEQKPVVLQVDKQVPSERLVAAIDEVKMAGTKAVNIATLTP